jgi:Arc/MetJ family transcription regulator
MRTNIDIDDNLMKQAMDAAGATTKRAAVETALRLMVQIKAQAKIRELRGKVVWRGNGDDWFASDEEIRKKHLEAQRATKPDLSKSGVPMELGQLVSNQDPR